VSLTAGPRGYVHGIVAGLLASLAAAWGTWLLLQL
jgi:hypothetical protein